MKKRVLSVLLSLAMVSAALAGCGSSGTSDAGGEAAEETEEEEAAEEEAAAEEDDFPKDNITITVAYSAGGSSDKLARMVQPYLEDALGVSVVVENQEGASGQIAAEAVMRGNQDGYQILAVNVPGLYYTTTFQETTYTDDDFVPLWIESYDPIIALALKDAEFDDLGGFIEAAKANPGKYSMGYVSGGGQEATAFWLQKNLGLDLNMVSYDGGSDASAALLGGIVDVIISDAYARASLVPDAKALGIGTTKPNTVWPDAVPFNEQLAAYDLEMPSDEFEARMGCYFVTKAFADEYPARYEKLVAAFESAAADETYIQALKDGNVYDSMVLESGEEYADALETMKAEVKDVVAPLLDR